MLLKVEICCLKTLFKMDSLFRWWEKNSISCLNILFKRVSFIPFLKRHYIFYCLQCTCIKIYQLVFIVCLQTYIFQVFPFVRTFVFVLGFFQKCPTLHLAWLCNKFLQIAAKQKASDIKVFLNLPSLKEFEPIDIKTE